MERIGTRTAGYVGHLYFLVMAILAIWFFEERAASFDDAYYFNRISDDNWFAFQHGRIGAFLPQLFTVLALKFGFGLKASLIAYSLSYVIAGWLCWMFIHFFSRQAIIGYAFILSQVILTKSLFFWPVSEGAMSAAYAFCLLGWLFVTWNPSKILFIGLSMVFVTCSIYTHPTGLLMSAGSFAMYFLWKTDGPRWRNLSYLALSTIFCYGVYAFKGLGGYEEEVALKGDQVLSRLEHISESANWFSIKETLFTDYLPLLLLFIAGIVGLVSHKKYLTSIAVLLSVIFCGVMACLTFFFGPLLPIIHQNSIIPVSFFVAAGFCLAYPGFFRRGYWAPILMVVLTWLMINRIGIAKREIDQRFGFQDIVLEHLQQFPEKKAVLRSDNIPLIANRATWSYSMETLIRTSLRNPEDPSVVCITFDQKEFDTPKIEKDMIPGPPFWKYMAYHSLNPQFFHVEHTPFLFLNADNCGANDSGAVSISVSLEDLSAEIHRGGADFMLEVHNTGDVPVCSYSIAVDNSWISYWFSNAQGEIVEDRNLHINLIWDILPGKISRSPFRVDTGLPKGKYIFHLAFNSPNGVFAIETKAIEIK